MMAFVVMLPFAPWTKRWRSAIDPTPLDASTIKWIRLLFVVLFRVYALAASALLTTISLLTLVVSWLLSLFVTCVYSLDLSHSTYLSLTTSFSYCTTLTVSVATHAYLHRAAFANDSSFVNAMPIALLYSFSAVSCISMVEASALLSLFSISFTCTLARLHCVHISCALLT